MYKMMIIDDEIIVAEGIRDTIPWKKYQVDAGAIADNGLTALSLCRTYHPDIILVDIQMPGMNGLDFIEKAQKILPNAVFIIISAYEKFSFAQRALELGVRFYLVKPIQEADIIDKVKKCILLLQSRISLHSSDNMSSMHTNKEDDFCRTVIREACSFIETRPFKDISLTDVADHVSLSTSYFSTLFKQEMNISFIDYVKKIKIERACHLLKKTNLKVYEICDILDYKSVQYFTTFFKEYMGMTPMEYRENITESPIPLTINDDNVPGIS